MVRVLTDAQIYVYESASLARWSKCSNCKQCRSYRVAFTESDSKPKCKTFRIVLLVNCLMPHWILNLLGWKKKKKLLPYALMTETSVTSAQFTKIDISAIESMVSNFSGDDQYHVYKWFNHIEDALDILISRGLNTSYSYYMKKYAKYTRDIREWMSKYSQIYMVYTPYTHKILV